MSTFLLIPGADGRQWYWHRLVPELQRLGHDPVAVELPAAPTSGLQDYADAAVATASEGRSCVVVAQSLGAFTGPLVCERLPVDLLVLLNPMIPAPGERAGDWWANVGQEQAATSAARIGGWPEEFDLRTHFFHDVPDDVISEALASSEGMAELDTIWSETWPLSEWPSVPTRVLQGRDDRFFPLDFQRRIARERLGVEVDEIPGGHLAALSHPAELAAALHAYVDAEPSSPHRVTQQALSRTYRNSD